MELRWMEDFLVFKIDSLEARKKLLKLKISEMNNDIEMVNLEIQSFQNIYDFVQLNKPILDAVGVAVAISKNESVKQNA